jgi:hypothetical protein
MMDKENEVLCSLSVPASLGEWGEHKRIQKSNYLRRNKGLQNHGAL